MIDYVFILQFDFCLHVQQAEQLVCTKKQEASVYLILYVGRSYSNGTVGALTPSSLLQLLPSS